MIRPLRGPATNTSDMTDLESPRDMRYGDACDVSRRKISVDAGVQQQRAHHIPFQRSRLSAFPVFPKLEVVA